MSQDKEYRAPFAAAESEFVEKRSRFIGNLWPVTTEAQAQEKLREVRARYHDARHHCWAYLLHDGPMRYSDDGEPQGTAGMPILEVLRREEVYDVLCVVTRYFGGILLGAGGLTRAYAKSARDVLAAAGVSRMCLWTPVQLSCAYPLLEQVKRLLAAAGAVPETVDYGAAVTLSARLPQAAVQPLQQQLTELSAGEILLLRKPDIFAPGPREEV